MFKALLQEQDGTGDITKAEIPLAVTEKVYSFLLLEKIKKMNVFVSYFLLSVSSKYISE